MSGVDPFLGVSSREGWAFVGTFATIGLAIATKLPADGYHIVLGQLANMGIAPALYPKLPYDPVKDLAPITTVADAPLVIVVAATSGSGVREDGRSSRTRTGPTLRSICRPMISSRRRRWRRHR